MIRIFRNNSEIGKKEKHDEIPYTSKHVQNGINQKNGLVTSSLEILEVRPSHRDHEVMTDP